MSNSNFLLIKETYERNKASMNKQESSVVLMQLIVSLNYLPFKMRKETIATRIIRNVNAIWKMLER